MFLLPLSSDHSVIEDSEEKELRISPGSLCFPFGPWRPVSWTSTRATVGNGLCGFLNMSDYPRLDAVQWDFSTSAPLTFLSWVILCCGGLLRALSGVYLAASLVRTHHLPVAPHHHCDSVTTHCQMSLGEANSHPQARTTSMPVLISGIHVDQRNK